ncbi:MAG TPA: VanZ family protein [Nannocystaceae bacterium]|nr:VanZ family protein [Nannocystaceae bacterium]
MSVRRLVAIGVTFAVLAFLWAPPPPAPTIQIPHLDKYLHLGLFFAVAASWRFARMPARRVLAFGILLGIVTEVVQGALPWPRTPDVLDVVADTIGIAIALGLARLFEPPR